MYHNTEALEIMQRLYFMLQGKFMEEKGCGLCTEV
jgi:hypothetical protein